MKTPKLKAAREALMAIERVYLRAAGFREIPPTDFDSSTDRWLPPPNDPRYRFMSYRTGHAINALKLWDRRDS